MELEASAPGEEPANRTEGFLSEDKLIEVYGRLGNILHAEPPLGKETDYRFFIDAVPGWLSEVMSLLECHNLYLYHRPDEFYLIKMFGDVDGELIPKCWGQATVRLAGLRLFVSTAVLRVHSATLARMPAAGVGTRADAR